MTKNNKVINSFGEEWKKFDQSKLNKFELNIESKISKKRMLKVLWKIFHLIAKKFLLTDLFL